MQWKAGHKYLALVTTFLLLSLLLACSSSPSGPDNEKTISRWDYSHNWPFTRSPVRLICENTGVTIGSTEVKQVFVRTNGRTYALNGSARNLLDGQPYNAQRKLYDYQEIALNGSGVGVMRVINDGLELCE